MVAVMILTLGVGLAVAGNGSQGVPSAKTSVGYGRVDFEPVINTWVDVPGLSATIKTSNVSDLIVSLTAEAALATDVKISSAMGPDATSTSFATIKARAIIDDVEANPAVPGDIVFNSRWMQLKGTLWGSTTSPIFVGLPDQYIEIWEKTRSANAFNFLVPNVGVGVHTVKIQIMTDKQAGYAGGDAAAVIGKRTLVVEAVRLVND